MMICHTPLDIPQCGALICPRSGIEVHKIISDVQYTEYDNI